MRENPPPIFQSEEVPRARRSRRSTSRLTKAYPSLVVAAKEAGITGRVVCNFDVWRLQTDVSADARFQGIVQDASRQQRAFDRTDRPPQAGRLAVAPTASVRLLEQSRGG